MPVKFPDETRNHGISGIVPAGIIPGREPGISFSDSTVPGEELNSVRMRLRELLAQERARLELPFLVSNAPVIMYRCIGAGDMRMTFISDNVRMRLGYEPHEFLEDPAFWWDHIHPEDREQVTGGIPRLNEKGTASSEYRLLTKEGEYRWIRDEVKAVFDEHGQPKEYLGYWIMVPECRFTGDALSQVNKKLNMLSSITRHDILNQVMALQMFLELSREAAKDPEALLYIGKEIEATKAIARQIDFTRHYQDIGMNTPLWQDIRAVIKSAQSRIEGFGSVVVENHVPHTLVYSDPLIESVFFNLMENSLRHGKRVTRVALSFSKTPDSATIVYEDNGTGISDRDKARLFRKGFDRNSGLGMFISQEILGITGLTITETGEKGKGARFEIFVPEGKYRFPAPENEETTRDHDSPRPAVAESP